MADAVFNVPTAALLMLGLARGDLELVGAGSRRPAAPAAAGAPVPALDGARGRARARSAPLGATISGAGPTVLVWTHVEQTGAVFEALREWSAGWATVQRAAFEPAGADVREL